MRSKIAAVVLVLMSAALLFGVNSATAVAASIGEHSDAAANLPGGLTGSVGSAAVLLGLVGLAFGLMRRGRRSLAAKRAVGQVVQVCQLPAEGQPDIASSAKSAA